MRKGFVGFLILIFAAGCSGNNQQTEEIQSDRKTENLVVYTMEEDLYADQAVGNFQKAYPETEVEVRKIPYDDLEEQRTAIAAEFMAGDGGDLYLNADDYFDDLYKMQEIGLMEDLMPWFREDPDFSEEDYVDGTFDLYEDTEECFVVPIYSGCSYYFLFNDRLQELGADPAEAEDMEEMIRTVWKFYEKYPEETAFSSHSPYYAGPEWLGFRVAEGNLEVFDSPVLRRMEELYKRQVYPEGESILTYDTEQSMREQEEILRGERCCLGKLGGIFQLEEYIRMGGEEQATIAGIGTDGPAVSCDGENFISAGSGNKEMAFELLKMYMDEVFHSAGTTTVNKEANKTLMENIRNQYGRDQVVIDEKTYPGLTQKTFGKLEADLNRMAVYPQTSYEMSGKYREMMEPFYTGEASFDRCMGEFKEYMGIYYSE